MTTNCKTINTLDYQVPVQGTKRQLIIKNNKESRFIITNFAFNFHELKLKQQTYFSKPLYSAFSSFADGLKPIASNLINSSS